MKSLLAALALSLTFAPFAHAQMPSPAGFAPSSVWLSKTSLTDGDTVSAFTVLYNASGAPLTGMLVFTEDGTGFATKSFTLAAGATEIESVSWAAKEGAHSIAARIENASDPATKTKTPLSNESAGSVNVTVAAPPPPPPAPVAVASGSGGNASTTGTSAGAVALVQSAADTAYKATESLRQAGAAALSRTVAEAAASPSGSVLGTSTSKVSAVPPSTGINSFIPLIWHGGLTALLFVFRLQILFYIALLFVLFVLYKLLRVLISDRRHR